MATLALAAAAAGGWASREALFAFVFVLGATLAFEMPAAQSLLPTLVPASMLSRAVAIASSAHQAATIGGPALGEFESGVVAAWLGPVAAVVLGGLGTLVVVGLWMRIFPSLAQRDRLDPGDGARVGH